MKLISAGFFTEVRRRGFSLVEVMVAFGVGLPVAGAVGLLLVQAASEQRLGLANATVEESAYILQSRITTCLRSMSRNGGCSITPDGQTIDVFHADTNGTLTRARITFNPSSGQEVIYTPNMASSGNYQVWVATNNSTMALRQLTFSGSWNLSGSTNNNSINNSLVNVSFVMDDNGYSRNNPNHLASIDRSFSVQMRGD